MIEKSFCWCANKNSISNWNNRSRCGEGEFFSISTEKFFFYEKLMKIISTNTFFFFWTWDSFCLLYWRGSYFLTNVSSRKFFFWEERWVRFNCTRFFFFFFFDITWGVFFLTSGGEFFKLLNRSRGLLEVGRHFNVKAEIYYFCQFTILTKFLSFR